MNVYLAGSDGGDMTAISQHAVRLGASKSTAADAVSPRRPIRLLLSYHYFKQTNIDDLVAAFGDVPVDLFCDSGAFSAFSLGATVSPEEYTEWVRRWQHHFNLVAGPDVIGDPAATEAATRKMASDLPGVRVLPTFHVGEAWEYLERYVAEYGYIALGGMVPYVRRRGVLASWLDKCFEVIPDSVGVHGFGLTTWPLLLRYPFTSVDSSTWMNGFRYGALRLFNPDRHRFTDVHMNDTADILRNMKLLHRYGLRSQDVASASYSRDRLVASCVDAWRMVETYLSSRRTHRGQNGATSVFRVTSSMGSAPNNPHVIANAITPEAQ